TGAGLLPRRSVLRLLRTRNPRKPTQRGKRKDEHGTCRSRLDCRLINASIAAYYIKGGKIDPSAPGYDKIGVKPGTVPFFFLFNRPCSALWLPFALQTVFADVAAAVIVNLFPRKKVSDWMHLRSPPAQRSSRRRSNFRCATSRSAVVWWTERS